MEGGGSVCIFCKSGAHRAPFLAGLFLLWAVGKAPVDVYGHLVRMRPIVQRIFDAQMETLAPLLRRQPLLPWPRVATAANYRKFWLVRPEDADHDASRPY